MMRSTPAYRRRPHLRAGLFLGALGAAAALALGCAAATPPASPPLVPLAAEPTATRTALALHGAAAGVPLTRAFKVVDQEGAAAAGVGIYVDGVCAGATDANGALEYAARDGAAVVALRRTGEQPAARRSPTDPSLPPATQAACADGSASCTGFGCAYQAFQTSLDWRPPAATAPQGTAEPYAAILSAGATAITLTIAPTRPLILFNLLVSIEWDAEPAYLADLAAGLREASLYIWDYTDGQMALGEVAILDDGDGWSVADVQIRASNEICPQASIGGMMRPPASTRPAITLGPYWTESNGATPDGRWSLPAGYRTIGHEFAHYALGLYDQYVDETRRGKAWCTVESPLTAKANINASIMDRQSATSELDDERFNWTSACTHTWHYAVWGQSAWATISERRWAGAWLTSPSRQDGRNPGPNTWPSALPAWPIVSDYARSTRAMPVSLQVNGAGSYDVYVMQCRRESTGRSQRGRLSIPLGRAFGGEPFAVLGARPGDLIWVSDRKDTLRYGAVRVPTEASAAPALVIQPCERPRPTSCDDPFPDGVCTPGASSAPAPPVAVSGLGEERRSLYQHGYRRNPAADAFPNALESADGRLRLYLDQQPDGDIAIIEQAVPEEIRQFLRQQELVPASKLYRIVSESQIGFSGAAQVQSICPPRFAPTPPSLWQATPLATSSEELRMIRIEQASWFPQEGYVLARFSAPGAYVLAVRP